MKFALLASAAEAAQAALAELKASYHTVEPTDADVIVALGGDGFMLETLHAHLDRHIPIFGMHRGSVGFLMNEYRPHGLVERLAGAEPVRLNPLRIEAVGRDGLKHESLALNEVALLRQSRQMAKIAISVDGVRRMDELMCDGVMLATPAGSTAYNFSAHGPIIPLGSGVLALTPISAFRPRRWRGAILPHQAVVSFEVLECEKRPVSVAADSAETRDIIRVEVREERDIALTLLFDQGQNLQERMLAEQFAG